MKGKDERARAKYIWKRKGKCFWFNNFLVFSHCCSHCWTDNSVWRGETFFFLAIHVTWKNARVYFEIEIFLYLSEWLMITCSWLLHSQFVLSLENSFPSPMNTADLSSSAGKNLTLPFLRMFLSAFTSSAGWGWRGGEIIVRTLIHLE